MTAKDAMQSQYLAALAMLREMVERCPPALWLDAQFKNQTWQVAYHALFFTHLYLHPKIAEFKAWERHRTDYENLGPHRMPNIGEPYSQADVLEYLILCEEQVRTWIPQLDLEGPSGFDWLPFNKLEHLLYNLRHLQQHTGELSERLGTNAGLELGWVGSRPA